jgi:hypothetical protein
MEPNQKEQRDICYYILAYLSENPDPGDSFAGIVQWWLLEQQIKFETRNVSEAVAKLVSEGLIVQQQKSDESVIYKLNREKEKAIRAMLSQLRPSGS